MRMKKKKRRMTNRLLDIYIKARLLKERVCGRLASNSGEGFVDTAVKILISIVVGALVLAGLYALFGDTILPTLSTKIKEMFNYSK